MPGTSPSYWQPLPMAIKIATARNVHAELTGGNAELILAPIRASYSDVDAQVVELGEILGRVETALGGREILVAAQRAQHEDRSAAVDALERYFFRLSRVADELAARGVGEARQLKTLLADLHADLSHIEASAIAYAVLPFVSRNAAVFDGRGLNPTIRAEGEALRARVVAEAGEAQDELAGQQGATAELRDELDRLVQWLVVHALRREVVQSDLRHPLPGFTLEEAEQWHATRGGNTSRPSAPSTSTTAPSSGSSVLGDAMAAFRGATPASTDES